MQRDLHPTILSSLEGIVDQMVWSDDQYRYVPKDDGSKTVEITFRTAIEDVSAVSEIAQYFR